MASAAEAAAKDAPSSSAAAAAIAAPIPSAPRPHAAEPVPPSALRDEASGARALTLPASPMMKTSAVAQVVIASPDRASRWRLASGAIEHTTDDGQTWQAQSIGVTTPMLAGAAPAARVCWLVGAGGVMLRTTDGGATWARIAFPDPVDLVAVQAIDASHATVTTVTGRRFQTSDGGTTWTPQ